MILCCGEALIDFLPRKTAEGAMAYQPVCGGSVYNTAIALGRLGVPVGLFTGVSTDFFGDMLQEGLKASKVSLGYTKVWDRPSTLAFVKLTKGHARYSFFDDNSAGRMLTARDLPKLGKNVQALHFGAISLIPEPGGATLISATVMPPAAARGAAACRMHSALPSPCAASRTDSCLCHTPAHRRGRRARRQRHDQRNGRGDGGQHGGRGQRRGGRALWRPLAGVELEPARLVEALRLVAPLEAAAQQAERAVHHPPCAWPRRLRPRAQRCDARVPAAPAARPTALHAPPRAPCPAAARDGLCLLTVLLPPNALQAT